MLVALTFIFFKKDKCEQLILAYYFSFVAVQATNKVHIYLLNKLKKYLRK